MLSAMERLIRFHPGSQMGRLDRRVSDIEVFEKLESRPVRRKQVYRDYEAKRSKPVWTMGELAATAALVVVFCGVLAVIARFGAEWPSATQDAAAPVSEVAESR